MSDVELVQTNLLKFAESVHTARALHLEMILPFGELQFAIHTTVFQILRMRFSGVGNHRVELQVRV